MSSNSPNKQLNIFIHTMDGAGHLGACVGIAQALAKRGHTVTGLLNIAFKGHFERFGFREILLTRNSDPTTSKSVTSIPENPVKGFAEQLLKSGFLSGIPPIEKIKLASHADSEQNFVQTLFDSTVDFNPQIEKAILEEKPDLIILDHFLVPPCFKTLEVPWMFLFSGNPLCMYDRDDLPPFGSGYPSNEKDTEKWAEFRETSQKWFYGPFQEKQLELYRKFGYEPKDPSKVEGFVCRSNLLNIYQYPEELDYDDQEPEGFARVDAFIREVPEKFELPENFRTNQEKLVYVSLGSMGSIDVRLMKRIVEVLGKLSHLRFIVSKGPLGDEYELPDNCWGQNFLPQTALLPLVDLVITHGGNNTTTESVACGKPMIVLPLFGDQYDNAQRVTEMGFGTRLDTYHFKDEELVDAIEKLLKDDKLYQRLEAAKQRIQAGNSKERLCIKIEQVLREARAARDGA